MYGLGFAHGPALDFNKLKGATKYTVSVESSREHGTYQIDRQEMTFNGKPQRLEFKPGAELGPVAFDYHKIVK